MDLFEAARTGDLEQLRECINKGHDPNARDLFGQTALFCAAAQGHAEVIEALLEAGAEIDARVEHCDEPREQTEDWLVILASRAEVPRLNRELLGEWPAGSVAKRRDRRAYGGPTALMAAAERGHLRALRLLIERGARLERKDQEGCTALALAVLAGQAHAVRVLVEAGARPNRFTHASFTPLHLALVRGHDEIVVILLDAGARPDLSGRYHHLPLHVAAREGQETSVRALLQAGADPDATSHRGGNTAMELALDAAHNEIVRLLIGAGADPGKGSGGSSPLQRAIQKGNLEAVGDLVAAGVDRESRSDWGLTPLMIAARQGEAEIVGFLIEAGADLDAQAGGGPDPTSFVAQQLRGRTALSLAAEAGHERIVELLLGAGADPNRTDHEGSSALLHALRGRHTRIAERLQSQGASSAGTGEIALIQAAGRGDLVQVKELLAAGVDVNTPQERDTASGQTPLMAAAEAGHFALLEALLDAGADVTLGTRKNPLSASSRTALWRAAEKGHAAACRLLLERGANPLAPESPTGQGAYEPALHAAVRGGHREIVSAMLAAVPGKKQAEAASRALREAAVAGHIEGIQMLLALGADVNASDSTYGQTALMLASQQGHLEAVDLLLSSGADPTLQDKAEQTAFDLATIMGRKAVVKRLAKVMQGEHSLSAHDIPLVNVVKVNDLDLLRQLLAAGADPNVPDEGDGWTPLHAAVFAINLEAIRLLLEHGADLNARCDNEIYEGQTPLQFAAFYGRHQVVDLLADNGADLEARDAGGRTPLLIATDGKQHETMRRLIARGALVNAQDDSEGKTALMLATLNDDREAIKILREAGADVAVQDLDGNTALDLAARHRLHAVARLLGGVPAAKVVAPAADAKALKQAAETGNAATIRGLIEQGADRDARLAEGRTPLMLAAGSGNAEVVETLVALGADVHAVDRSGKSALFWAIEGKCAEAVRTLLKAGVSPDSRGTDFVGNANQSALFATLTARSIQITNAWQDVVNGFQEKYIFCPDLVEIIRLLIEAGANLDVPDESGNLPVTYAIDSGQPEIARILADAGAGKDPISQSYLEAQRLTQRYPLKAFQAILARIVQDLGGQPEPLRMGPTEREWFYYHRGQGVPYGPPFGARLRIGKDKLGAWLKAHRALYWKQGIYVFEYDHTTQDILAGRFDAGPMLGLLPTANPYAVIAAICEGGDCGISPSSHIHHLRAIEQDFSFVLAGCGSRSISLEFDSQIADISELVRRLMGMQLTLWAEGLGADPSRSRLEKYLAKRGIIGLAWE